MPISFNSGGAWRTAADVWFNDAGTWRRLVQAWRNDGGTWRKVHQMNAATAPLAVTATPPSYALGVDSTSAAGSFSRTFTATPSGGTGPYGGSWSQVASGPTAATHTGDATTVLTLSGSWPQHTLREYSETWRYTATDSTGATATFDITLHVTVTDNR